MLIIADGRIVAEDTPDNLDRRRRGAEIVSLQVRGPRESVLTALQGVESVLAVEPRGGDGASGDLGTYQVSHAVGSDVREALASAVVANGWGLLELRRTSRSLEEIFLDLTTSDTEHQADEAEADDEAPTEGVEASAAGDGAEPVADADLAAELRAARAAEAERPDRATTAAGISAASMSDVQLDVPGGRASLGRHRRRGTAVIGRILAVTQRELKSYFVSPVAYVVIALFLVVCGLLFGLIVLSTREASLRYLLSNISVVFLFLVPAMTMRLLAEEQGSGTMERC